MKGLVGFLAGTAAGRTLLCAVALFAFCRAGTVAVRAGAFGSFAGVVTAHAVN